MCRTMTGFNVKTGDYKKLGRGNNVPVTINLPYLALWSKRDNLNFFDLLDDLLDKARRSLLIRYDLIRKQSPKSAPFMYENKTIMNADKCIDTVEPSVENNTLAIGYIGIAETVKVLTGKYHCETKDAEELGIKIARVMREYCDELTKKYNLNFSLYPSPSEGFCEQALNGIVKEFGIIEGISDKKYITNSHHCPVELGVPVFKKIEIESKYAKYCNGGFIFHFEVDGMNYNEKAITKAIDHALDNDIPYMRLSHPIATCLTCGYNEGNIMFKCGKCGGEKIENLAIVTGYLTSDISNMNQGKQDEVNRRELNKVE